MRRALALAWLLLTVPLAGCMDIFGGGGDAVPEGRDVYLDMYVCAPTSNTIELYEKNDGTQMRSVAIGFQADCGDALTVPNPAIELWEGDNLHLTLHNLNPLPHTLHLHGGLVDWTMDGVPFLNQMPVHQGESYTYIYEDLKAGTYFYHCHVDVAHHMDLGMYGSFIVKEREPTYNVDREFVLMLDEWDNCHVHGNTDPIENAENNGAIFQREECVRRVVADYTAQGTLTNPIIDQICAADPPPDVAQQLQCGEHAKAPPGATPRGWYPVSFPLYDPEYNTYLINGKAYPDTQPLRVQSGETVRIRMINVGEQMHSMHLHGHYMLVTHRDGYELPAPFKVDTLGIMPGERYDVIVEMDNDGFWAFHDHVALHVMNDHQAPGGMFTCLAYDGFMGYDVSAFSRALDCNEAAMEIHAGHGH